jgi:hypothetical protein
MNYLLWSVQAVGAKIGGAVGAAAAARDDDTKKRALEDTDALVMLDGVPVRGVTTFIVRVFGNDCVKIGTVPVDPFAKKHEQRLEPRKPEALAFRPWHWRISQHDYDRRTGARPYFKEVGTSTHCGRDICVSGRMAEIALDSRLGAVMTASPLWRDVRRSSSPWSYTIEITEFWATRSQGFSPVDGNIELGFTTLDPVDLDYQAEVCNIVPELTGPKLVDGPRSYDIPVYGQHTTKVDPKKQKEQKRAGRIFKKERSLCSVCFYQKLVVLGTLTSYICTRRPTLHELQLSCASWYVMCLQVGDPTNTWVIKDNGSGVWEPGTLDNSNKDVPGYRKKSAPELGIRIGDKLTVSMWPDGTFMVKITPKRRDKGRNVSGGRRVPLPSGKRPCDGNAQMYGLVGVHGVVKAVKLCAPP